MSNTDLIETNQKDENLSKRKLATFGKHQEEKRAASGYIDRERDWQNETIKSVERPRVADFLLSHHEASETMRLLSLPSIHWSFEHLLLERCPERAFRFFGLEWTWGVMELGRPFIPGGKATHSFVQLSIGKIQRFVTAEQNDKRIFSHWLWVEAASFLSLNRKDKADANRFAHVYKRMSAVWLDFTSPLCAQTRESLKHLGGYCDMRKAAVPVAITLLAARDDYSSDEKRAAAIGKLLDESDFRSFELLDFWKYVHNDTPMLTVCGVLKLR